MPVKADGAVESLPAILAKLHTAVMRSLEWDDLRFFLAFVRAGSMQAAAKALGVNQSTVQRRISDLEAFLGNRLVERLQGSYRLTALGQDLTPAAKQVEAAVEAFERQHAASDKGLTGSVRLTCGSSLAACLRQTPLIDAFQVRYPGLRVELVISERILDLSKGEADIAIRLGEPRDDALVGRKITDASWAVYASRGYIERYGRPENVADLNSHLLIGCEGAIAHYAAARWIRSAAPDATVVARSEYWQGVMLAVEAGVGLAAMPHWQGDSRGLVRVVDDIGVTQPYYLLMHRDMQKHPRVRAFADFVASEIRSFRTLLSGAG